MKIKNMLLILIVLTAAINVGAEENCPDESGKIVSCVKVEDMKGIEIDFNKINFGSTIPGKEFILKGDDILLSNDGKPTVKNIGTTEISIKIGAAHMTNMADTTKKIPPSSISVTVPKIDNTKYNLEEDATINGLIPDTSYALDFSIKIPTGTKSGNYKGTVSIVAI